MWKYDGKKRPDFAEKPQPGQESVWDYPRPAIARASKSLVEVRSGDILLAHSSRTYRVLETASPPVYYIPQQDIDMQHLKLTRGSSICEWKGRARYWGLASDPQGTAVGWSYPEPTPAFQDIKDYIAFFPGRVDCFVDGEQVRPQDGGFYGGWITRNIAGPFKGAPGTGHW
jgi:uncharacterized protein (DUF427 family)